MDAISLTLVFLHFCGVLQVSVSTSCSPQTLDTCDATLRVKDECVNRVCACATGYTAVPTGCADPNAIPKPMVKSGRTGSGVYSGEVFASEETNGTLDLFCHTEYAYAGGGKFRWYVGDSDSEEVNHLNQLFVVEDITASFLETFRCRVVDGGLESPLSEVFTVSGYGINGTVSKKPAVRGLPLLVLSGAEVTTECVNIPKDPNLEISWTPPQTTATFTVQGEMEDAIGSQCTISISDVHIDHAVSVMQEAVIVVPANLSLVMREGRHDVMLSKGQHYTLTCEVQGQVGLPSGEPTWTWKADTRVLEGQTTATVTVDTSTPEVLTYTCTATFPGDVQKELTKKVYIDDEVLVDNLAVAMPTVPLEGGHLNISCLVAAKSKAGLAFSWHYKGSLIPGQTDNTIQMNAVIPASDAGNYACTAHVGTIAVTSPDRVINIVALINATVTIRGGQERYGIGTEYTFTCESTSASPGTSFEWYRGAAKVSTEETYKYTPTNNRKTDLKCRMKFGADSIDSAVLDVVATNLVSVSVEGPSKPVTGTPVTYTCKVVKGHTAPAPRYQWLVDGRPIPAETLSTFKIESVDAVANARPYGCEVKSGEDPEDVLTADPLNVEPQDKPAQPEVTGPAVVQRTGHYKFYCVTDSAVPGAIYEWLFTKAEGDFEEVKILVTEQTFMEINNPTKDNAGSYRCRVDINDQTSLLSATKNVSYEDKRGLLCQEVADCLVEPHWYNYYTGNCIGQVCECAPKVPLNAYGCGKSSGPALKAAIVTILASAVLAALSNN